MPRHRILLVGLLLAIIILGHTACMLAMRECWPFSWYPVYSTLAQSDLVVYRMVAATVAPDGTSHESVVTSQKYVPGYTETYMRNALRRTFGWGTEPEMQRAADVVRDYFKQYEDRRKAGLHTGDPLSRVELRRLTFDSQSEDAETPSKSESLLAIGPDSAAQMLVEPAPKPPKPTRTWGQPLGFVGLSIVLAIIAFALRPGRGATFLFEPRDARWLGFNRVLFFALMVWFYWSAPLADVANRPPSSYLPTGFFYYLHVAPPVPHVMRMMQIGWLTALGLACLGVLTRLTTILSLFLGAYLLGMQHQWGKQGHGDAMLVLVMLVFAASRCGDAISIDALVRRHSSLSPLPLESGEYTWPIKLIWIIMSLAVGASGVAKLRVSGLDWALSDNLSNVIRQHFVGNYSNPFVPRSFGLWVADHPWLTKPAALASLLVETLFPLALLGVFWRRMVVPAMLFLQINIAVLMGVVFTQFLLVYAMWVNWPWLGDRIRKLWVRGDSSPLGFPVESRRANTP